MFCKRCGTQADGGTSFCGKCGEPLQSNEQLTQQGQQQPPRYQAFSPVSTAESGTPYTGAGDIRYAGFWLRVGASLLDVLILMIPFIILAFLFNPDMYSSDPDASANNSGWNAVSFALGFVYKAGMESSSKQGTLGKMICGIKVTDLGGNRISFGRAAGRYLAQILSSFTLLIGFMMAGWTARKQTLHDKITGSLVIRNP